jgi:hypothetical protein
MSPQQRFLKFNTWTASTKFTCSAASRRSGIAVDRAPSVAVASWSFSCVDRLLVTSGRTFDGHSDPGASGGQHPTGTHSPPPQGIWARRWSNSRAAPPHLAWACRTGPVAMGAAFAAPRRRCLVPCWRRRRWAQQKLAGRILAREKDLLRPIGGGCTTRKYARRWPPCSQREKMRDV